MEVPRHNSLLVPLSCMGSINLGRNSFNHNWHEPVQCTAKLRALSVENALTLDESGDAVQTAGGAVCLDAERENSEVVEHILSCAEETDVGSSWQGQPLVYFKLSHHAGFQILIRHKVALELVERRNLSTLQVLL